MLILDAFHNRQADVTAEKFGHTLLGLTRYARHANEELIDNSKCQKAVKKDFAFVTIKMAKSTKIERVWDISLSFNDKIAALGKKCFSGMRIQKLFLYKF